MALSRPVCGRLASALGLAVLLLSGCQTPPPATEAAPSAPAANGVPTPPRVAQGPEARPGARGRVLARSDRLLIYLPEPDDTPQAIAARFLGSASLAWRVAEANGLRPTADSLAGFGGAVVVPLVTTNLAGVAGESFQTVPILCYHRFGTGNSKMIMPPAQFEAQLDWLQRNGYTVVPLSALSGFLAGRDALPPLSVIITIDDGYESVYRYAFPALRKHGYAATLFVYTDFIGTRDGLSWAQLEEMAVSGVIDIQAHSKSHRNLVERSSDEGDAAYRQSIEAEVKVPRTVLEKRLSTAGVKVRHMAYPFGDANQGVLDALARNDYDLGLTVSPGGNPFYAHPLMLRRTMIFGDHTLDDFKARLQTQRPLARP
jgi:peptidoglycan/xylan/chitin deacetylase (PgdA/CDA1 family)